MFVFVLHVHFLSIFKKEQYYLMYLFGLILELFTRRSGILPLLKALWRPLNVQISSVFSMDEV